MKKKHLKTFYPKKESVNEQWLLYDAEGMVLGRAASEISSILLGKLTSTFTPGVNLKQHVVVINSKKIKVTGKKQTDKMYYRHSGYSGGLKEIAFDALMKKKPCEALRKAVNGMLPHNSYGSQLKRNVIFYEDENHSQQSQKPVLFEKESK